MAVDALVARSRRYSHGVSYADRTIRIVNLRNATSLPLFKSPLSSTRRRLCHVGNYRVLSMDAREKSRSAILESSKHKRVPIFVMMPSDIICIDSTGTSRIRKMKALTVSLRAMKLAGVHGIAVDVWWGIVEQFRPSEYNWMLYEELFKMVSQSGLKLHVALCFHSNKHSVNNTFGAVSLPLWILEIGDSNRDIYYRDKNGYSNDDYLTLGVDNVPLFCGRTALQCYEDFIQSFVNKFQSYIGSVIEEISVGLGPSGELRYPAHPPGDGRWKFPGIGEFQCYDKYMMEDLKSAACREGKPQWGDKGPQNAGCYNSLMPGIPFFEEGQDSFVSDYGQFFLEWYSGKLICHADAILAKTADALKCCEQINQSAVLLIAKIGGIYWWYQTVSHPAELTAGYYNTALRDGYGPVTSMLSRHGAALHISCLEMMDNETPADYFCSPEGLLKQIRNVSKNKILLTGRNTSERLDETRLKQILANCYHPQLEAVRKGYVKKIKLLIPIDY